MNEDATNGLPKILIVEDDCFLLEEMAFSFSKACVEVVGPVGTKEAAYLAASSDAFDGAVLDINLQGEVVYRFAEMLGSRGIPFVFVTGYNRSVLPAHVADMPFVEKPVEPSAVLEALFSHRAQSVC